jgi:hypothetical protein
VAAIARTCRRLNEAWNAVLYGENVWLLNLSTCSWESAKIHIDRSLTWDAERDSTVSEEKSSLPQAIACHTAIRRSARTPADTAAAAWPLSRRTAQYVRELVISGTTSTQVGVCDRAQYRYDNEWTLAARVKAVVNTFLGDLGDGDGQQASRHSLRRSAVQITSRESGSHWKLEQVFRKSIFNHDDSKGQSLRLSMRRDMPVNVRARTYPLPKAL